MLCPIHKTIAMVKCRWTPPDGLDPLTTRHACVDCLDYWYKTPKTHLQKWLEFAKQQGFALSLEPTS